MPVYIVYYVLYIIIYYIYRPTHLSRKLPFVDLLINALCHVFIRMSCPNICEDLKFLKHIPVSVNISDIHRCSSVADFLYVVINVENNLK